LRRSTLDAGPLAQNVSMTSRGRLALAALLAPLYAGCYAAIKSGLAFAPPLGFAALRALMAGAVLLTITAILGQPLFPPRRFWVGVGALAISGTFFAFGAMFLSPGRTGAGIASVLGNTMPIIIIVLAAVFLGEPVTRGKAAALLLGFVGVSFIAYPAITDPSGSGLLGAVLPLTAATGFASASVLIKRMGVGEALLSITAWQLIIGGGLLLLFAEWLEPDLAVAWTPAFISLLLFLAVLGTALTTALWYWLVQQDDVGRLSLVLFLVPVLGLGLAVALFGESVGILEAIGVVMTLTGLGAVVRESGRDPETSTPGASLRG
jgi:probable blue pigment (indigoidine) exporter